MCPENIVSVNAIARVSGSTATTRNTAVSTLQRQRSAISGMGSAWQCNSGRAFIQHMLGQFDEDLWNETLKAMDSYTVLLSQAAGNYTDAEQSNVRNEQSNRARFGGR